MRHTHEIKIFFKEAPFLKIIIPFILGIFFQDIFSISLIALITTLCCVLCLYLLFEYSSIEYRLKHHYLSGTIIFSFIFFIATIFHNINSRGNNTKIENYSFFVAELKEPITETEKTFRAILIIKKAFDSDKSAAELNEKIIAYFPKTDSNFFIDKFKNYTFIVKNNFKKLTTKNLNPGAFDFTKYYIRQQIFYTGFLQLNEYKLVDSASKSVVQKILLKSQDWINKTLQKYIINKTEYGLLEALLIGYKIDLDKNILGNYINSGTIHIIAISGLHLGCIYWVLAVVFLRGLNKNKIQKIIKCVTIIFVLFFYALLADANPSILRAAFMFSIIAIGNINNKKGSIYNLLAFSAFIILCLNTHTLFNLGFILSYVAILSLVIFNPTFSHILLAKNKAINFCKDIISSSLAAQILIFPILAYLFHYMPTYFVFNNLIAIPLSTFVLFLSFLLLIFSPIPFIAIPLGKFISMCVKWMNNSMQFSNTLPLSKIILPNFPLEQCLFYYLLIITISLFVFTKSFKYLRMSLILVISMGAVNIFYTYKLSNQEKIIFYQHVNKNIIEIVNGNRAEIYTDDSIKNNEYQFAILPAHYSLGIKSFNIKKHEENLVLKNKNVTIVYLKSFDTTFDCKEVINCDYLILNKKAAKHIGKITTRFSCKKIILDNSCSNFYVNQVINNLNKTYFVYSLNTYGAWIL